MRRSVSNRTDTDSPAGANQRVVIERYSVSRARPLRERIERNSYPMSAGRYAGCWLWLGVVVETPTGKAKPRLSLKGSGKQWHRAAHRAAFEAFVGPVPTGFVVRRECGNDRCVAPHHLRAEPAGQRTADEKRIWRQTRARRRAERLREFIDAQKAAPCMDCQRTFPACCMDFDHRDGVTKLYGVSDAPSMSAAKAEMAKCDLVCACCHRLRTQARLRTPQG